MQLKLRRKPLFERLTQLVHLQMRPGEMQHPWPAHLSDDISFTADP